MHYELPNCDWLNTDDATGIQTYGPGTGATVAYADRHHNSSGVIADAMLALADHAPMPRPRTIPDRALAYTAQETEGRDRGRNN